MSYADFLASKRRDAAPAGFDPQPLSEWLFPWQRALTTWALRRGRCAVFADTGLGKTRVSLEWARQVTGHTGGNVLMLAPLAVAAQTSREAKSVGLAATLCRDGADVQPGINITNYDRLHRFDASAFSGVVLDESSIIKHHDAKTLGKLVAAFGGTPYRLCATATPAPNDWTELGTHAEFLGVCSRTEMLAEYFCHDGGETSVWRLKGHARDLFWRWVSSWGALVRRPSDLGYDDNGYNLPPLDVRTHIVDGASSVREGMLFAVAAETLTEQRQAKRESMAARVDAVSRLIAEEPDEPWVVWCETNAEQDALETALGPAVSSIRGADTPEDKESRHAAWLAGETRVLLSKPSIFGWGLNWQHCARMAFVGVTHSYEGFYQAVRRCYRFGQRRPVVVHVVCGDGEVRILQSLREKEKAARAMGDQMIDATRSSLIASMGQQTRTRNSYDPHVAMTLPEWLTAEAS